MQIRNALISVSDKSGLPELVAALSGISATIYSTGGTAAAIRAAGGDVKDISVLTGANEMLDGRVKTLHPHVHAAILADTAKPDHKQQLDALNLPKMDLVVVNFYPFEQTAAGGGDDAAVIEDIDIGGPTMVRAAAKNHTCTTVLTNPNDYPVFIGALKQNKGDIPAQTRRQLATKAFINIAHLDTAIANYFSSKEENLKFPRHQFLHLEKIADLSYGENPHQEAACYVAAGNDSGFTQLQGPPVSYNNLLDAYSAYLTVHLHDAPAAAIIKHNNPCGVAVAGTLKSALQRAQRTDSVSAFGGVVAFNRPLDGDTAELLQKSFWEVITAPQFNAEAKSILAFKERLRLLISSQFSGHDRLLTSNGRLLLMQDPDQINDGDGIVKSKRRPSSKEMRDLQFAWRVAAAAKSNAIVIAKDGATSGIGVGQMSRIDSAWLACEKAKRAGIKIKGAVAASDGFFPFTDGLTELAEAGVTAVIQPGGSKNDGEVIAAADSLNIAMVFSGRRHFRH